jgi:hypothetical protein
MKKFVFALLLCLLLVPASAFAQDPQLLWDLSQVVDLDDYGIRLNAPDGWAVVEDRGATYILANEDDLEAISDADPDTPPTDYAIAASAFPLEFLQESAALPLDQILESLIAAGGNFDLAETGEVAVNIRPAYLGIGTGDGLGVIITIWKQDGNLVIMLLTVPSEETNVDEQFSWGSILGLVRPIVPDDFAPAEERYEINDLNLSILYPDGWATADTIDLFGVPGAAFAENEDDLSAETPEGVLIGVIQIPGTPEDLDLDEDATSEDMVMAFAGLMGVEDVKSEGDFIVGGLAGVGFTGENAENGRPGFGIVTYNPEAEAFTVFTMGAPDEDALEEFTPVFLAMVWSAAPLE